MKITKQIMTIAKNEGRKILLESEAKMIIQDYGIEVTRFRLAKNESEVAKFAEELGYPIVLKIVSPDVVHKSDVGGVVVDIKDSKQALEAYNQILENVTKKLPKAKIVGILVQEMARQGIEVIIGATKDPQFGPALMFGLGGVFVEVLKDVTFRIAPVSIDEAREMITEVKAYPLLKGYRNNPPADVDAIVHILHNTSRLVSENEEIKELDLNPIIVYEKGALAVDARIILE